MAIQQWTWSNFYLGIWEDRRFWAEKGYFQANYGIDTQAEPRWIRLNAWIVEQYDFDYGNCTLMGRLEDWFSNQSGWLHVVNDKLYKNGILVGSLSSWVTGWCQSSISSGAYVLFFGTSAIDVLNVSTNTLTLSIWSFTGYGTARPTLSMTTDDSSGWTVYFWSWHKIKKVLHTWPTTVAVSDVLTVSIGEQITWLTRYNTEYRVYTKAWLSNGSLGKQYMWDWATNAVQSVVEWNSTPILAVANAWMIDYVLAGISEEFTDLYIATGTERKLVRTGLAGWRGRRFLPKMTVCKDIVYILGAMDLARVGETSQRVSCIFSYGTENAWFPKGLQIEHEWTEGQVDYCNLYATDDNLYFLIGKIGATETAYSYSLQKRLAPNVDYRTSGIIVSNTFQGWVVWAVKELKQINIGYSLESELWYGGSIKLYYRVKTYGDFTLLSTITDSSENFTKIFGNQIEQTKFNELELKLELIADGDKTPFVYEVTTIYDDNLRA